MKIKQVVSVIIGLSVILAAHTGWAAVRYGQTLCKKPDYDCVRVKRGQTWASLFPDPEQRDIVRRVNRFNMRVYPGMVIAVPKNLSQLTVYDVAPFPRYIDAPGEKTIYVSQKELAWGAYGPDGELVWWGPISPGKDYCSDVGQACNTPKGSFRMIRKQGIECESSKFPIETMGGAPMPYCMHFYRGFALHGSYSVPGYRASHGCVRLFIEDAKWLNEEFIETTQGDRPGTRVIVGPT